MRVDHVLIDTIRVPRETFADIWRAWRDGYTDVLVEHGAFTRALIEAHWADMIECICSTGYACWTLPVVSGRVPAR